MQQRGTGNGGWSRQREGKAAEELAAGGDGGQQQLQREEEVEEEAEEEEEEECLVSGLRVDPLQGSKSMEIELLSARRPHMRAFHFAWLSLMVTFLAWFALPPLFPVIVRDLQLSETELALANAAAVGSTVFCRVIIGPILERKGPRFTQVIILLYGIIPLGAVSLVQNAAGFIIVRCFLGFLGGAFVASQFWSSSMFAREVVGAANATTAGWGNLGGGISFLVMPAVYAFLHHVMHLPSSTAWKTSVVLPAIFLVVCAYGVAFYSDDSPEGAFVPLSKKRASATTIANAASGGENTPAREEAEANPAAPMSDTGVEMQMRAQRQAAPTLPQAADPNLPSSGGDADVMTGGVQSPSSSVRRLVPRQPPQQKQQKPRLRSLKGMRSATDDDADDEYSDLEARRTPAVVPNATAPGAIKRGSGDGRNSPGAPPRRASPAAPVAVSEERLSKPLFRSRNIWILMLSYALSFGMELHMNNILSLYLFNNFETRCSTADDDGDDKQQSGNNSGGDDTCPLFTETEAGILSSLFGLMNLFARALGGFASDYWGAAERANDQGRVAVLFAYTFFQGFVMILFGLMDASTPAIFLLLIFSFAVQASEGACFALVPMLHVSRIGVAAGVVGAGGNLGAVTWALIFGVFGSSPRDYPALVVWLGVATMVLSVSILFIDVSQLDRSSHQEHPEKAWKLNVLRMLRRDDDAASTTSGDDDDPLDLLAFEEQFAILGWDSDAEAQRPLHPHSTRASSLSGSAAASASVGRDVRHVRIYETAQQDAAWSRSTASQRDSANARDSAARGDAFIQSRLDAGAGATLPNSSDTDEKSSSPRHSMSGNNQLALRRQQQAGRETTL